jgi:hypothetical protein
MLAPFQIILTTIFLTANHLHPTFASPLVSNGDVAVGPPLNLTHSLAEHQVQAPADQQCSTPALWAKRICRPVIGLCVWEDQCWNLQGVINHYILRLCPENTYCQPILFFGRESALCYPVAAAGTSKAGEQTGFRLFRNLIELNVEHIYSVTLENDVPIAAVSAMLEGTYYIDLP